MNRPIRYLLLEDDPGDAELVLYQLRKQGFDPVGHHVLTEEDFVAHLQPDLDIILSDYSLPGFSGLRAL
ncbi:MAG: hypothetical protein K8S54_18115 [Spirochaetia bacterium]|nr:hypothetical protein [Spirochaetia bacterium]